MYIIINIFEIIVDLILSLCAGDDFIKMRKYMENSK